jgi:hypothetical protein
MEEQSNAWTTKTSTIPIGNGTVVGEPYASGTTNIIGVLAKRIPIVDRTVSVTWPMVALIALVGAAWILIVNRKKRG